MSYFRSAHVGLRRAEGLPVQYMSLPLEQREALLASLEDMPRYLGAMAGTLSADLERQRSPDDLFSPVEQIWHLADLERGGFGLRIERLLTEHEPQLPDFDGAAVAIARDYRSLSLEDGLVAFREARRRNLDTLRQLAAQDWNRSGHQEGVGPVSLCDMPSFMAQHDAAHRAEIESWKQQLLR
jgi:DinB family protein